MDGSIQYFEGDYFAPQTSTKVSAIASFDGQQLAIYNQKNELLNNYTDHAQMQIMPPVAGALRKVRFADGSLFECEGTDSFIQFENALKGSRNRLIYKLEGSMPFVGGALVLTVILVASFIIWGLPWVARDISQRFPHDIREQISQQTKEIIDNQYMSKSTLNAYEQKEIRDMFKLVEEHTKLDLHLYIRSFKQGPNAFALPDGTIFYTDELYNLSDDPNQVLAVLLHEAAHVEKQHSIQLLVRQSGVALIASLFLGDVSGWSDLAAGLPSFIIQNSYSREFETEADLYAAEKMVEMGKDPEAMKRILYLLESDGGEIPMQDWLLTHPTAKTRMKSIDDYLNKTGYVSPSEDAQQ